MKFAIIGAGFYGLHLAVRFKALGLETKVFEKKDEIANAVKGELNDAMTNYGYDIIKALVTDIDPDAEVKSAMNQINAAERKKVAAQYEGDAERIFIVEKAKAEAESKRLQGQGIADQRREMARGLEDSVDVLNNVGKFVNDYAEDNVIKNIFIVFNFIYFLIRS